MARDTVRFNVDISKAAKKMTELERGFKKTGAISVKEASEWGKNFARTIAPYRTGQLVRLIKLFNISGDEARIVAQNPTASDGHPRGEASTRYAVKGKFHLVRWMHMSQYARSHIKTGDPRFMYTTGKEMRKRFPQTVRRRVNELIIKENNK